MIVPQDQKNKSLPIMALQYIVGIFQAGLYTLVVVSFAMFAIFIPMLFFSGMQNPLLRFVPSGDYDTGSLMGAYVKYAFLLGLAISFIERFFKRKFSIAPKKKVLILGIALAAGYGMLYLVWVFKMHFHAGVSALMALLFFGATFASVALSALLASFENFLDKQ